MSKCPCGSGKDYEKCCDLFISGADKPQSPEQLMRSRYSAFVNNNLDYVMQTITGPAARDFSRDDAQNWVDHVEWVGLEVKEVSSVANDTGFVEFIARFKVQGKDQMLHEIGEFHRQDGVWSYYDGKYPKTGRNDPCPCGSGKKYKKCCCK